MLPPHGPIFSLLGPEILNSPHPHCQFSAELPLSPPTISKSALAFRVHSQDPMPVFRLLIWQSQCSSDLPVLVLTWLPSDPPHPPTMSGWSFCYSNLMSPRPCLKHIDGSFLIAKWVPTPYQGTQDALITHLSTYISLHSLFHVLLACTKLFPSFVPLQTPEMLFSLLIIWWCPFISPFQLNHICSTKAS